MHTISKEVVVLSETEWRRRSRLQKRTSGDYDDECPHHQPGRSERECVHCLLLVLRHVILAEGAKHYLSLWSPGATPAPWRDVASFIKHPLLRIERFASTALGMSTANSWDPAQTTQPSILKSGYKCSLCNNEMAAKPARTSVGRGKCKYSPPLLGIPFLAGMVRILKNYFLRTRGRTVSRDDEVRGKSTVPSCAAESHFTLGTYLAV